MRNVAVRAVAGPIAEQKLNRSVYGLFRTAIHEAAHAVVGFLQNEPINYVHITPMEMQKGPRVMGVCAFGKPDGSSLASRIELYQQNRVFACSDRRVALVALSSMDKSLSWQDLRREYRSVAEEAELLVRTHWVQIYVVASHLHVREAIDGSEASAIIRDAITRHTDALDGCNSSSV